MRVLNHFIKIGFGLLRDVLVIHTPQQHIIHCHTLLEMKKEAEPLRSELSPSSRSVSGMCGMDVDLDDGGAGEEEKDEELWIGEGVKMLPPPVAHSGGSAWGSRRGRCGCVACGAALILWNLCVVLASLLLLAVIFSLVLLPALVLLYVGFLCHSRVSCPKVQGWEFSYNQLRAGRSLV